MVCDLAQADEGSGLSDITVPLMIQRPVSTGQLIKI